MTGYSLGPKALKFKTPSSNHRVVYDVDISLQLISGDSHLCRVECGILAQSTESNMYISSV